MGHTYDAAAATFDSHRVLPTGVPEAIRRATLGILNVRRPRILDVGAGTGRIGRAFVAAGDNYVGVDLSLGMLREFAAKGGAPLLVQGDGERLCFRDGSFGAVLLFQVVGAVESWRRLVSEARRLLQPCGALIVGHTVFPAEGIDEQMKRRLAAILEELGVCSYHTNTRGVVQPWLESKARTTIRIRPAVWTAKRTPRAFFERQPTGARFSILPNSIQLQALQRLQSWVTDKFSSIDTVFEEQHEFELKVFHF